MDLDSNATVIRDLQPYDTSSTLGYITTLAMAYVPTGMVDTLALAITTPGSQLYNNPDSSVNTLMSMINPSIPLVAGGSSTGASGTETGSSASASSSATDSGAPLSGSSSSVKASAAAIGVGAVAAAAAYGAAMFFVAKRYKKRKSMHQRASSTDVGAMAERNGGMRAFMSGGRSDGYRSVTPGGRNSQNSGRSGSARTQMISAPVMAENSLGWN